MLTRTSQQASVKTSAIALLLAGLSSLAGSVQAQTSYDQTQRGLAPQTQPAPKPVTGPILARRPLGGVPAKIPSPHSGGSLLEKRMRPFPYPTKPLIPCTPGESFRRPIDAGSTTTIAPVVADDGVVIRPGLTVRDGVVGLHQDSTRRFLHARNPIIVAPGYVDLSGSLTSGLRKYPYFTACSSRCDRTDFGGETVGAPIVSIDPALLRNASPSEYRDIQNNQWTEVDLAEAALADGDYARAVDMYREQIRSAPSDVESARMLAFAMILNRDTLDGAAALAIAYRRAPELGSLPRPAQPLWNTVEFRNAVSRLMQAAARTPTPDLLFAAAVAKQWEGQVRTSMRMLDRASAAGFDQAAVKSLRTVLGPHLQGKH